MSRRALAVGAALALAAGGALIAIAVTSGDDGTAAPSSSLAWRALRPAPLERTEVAAARVGRFIYVVGGFAERGATTAAVERYDIERNSWRRSRSMPLALDHPAAVAYRGRVYVLGGYRGPGLSNDVATLLRYDPRRNAGRGCRALPRDVRRSRSA